MTVDLDDLAAGLSEFADKRKKQTRTPADERIISGFEEICRFVEEQGRAPANYPDRDIFERLYAVRLQRIKSLPDAVELVSALDAHGLLSQAGENDSKSGDSIDIDELSAALGDDFSDGDLTELKHVRSSAEKRAAEEIAARAPCTDFDKFKPLFETIRAEIRSGERLTAPFGKDAQVELGDFFILDGLTAYVASVGEEFFNDGQDRKDARLRVIFSNKTESNLLRTSLQKALHKDEASRRVAREREDSLFADTNAALEEGDVESGTIYVLRSQSNEEFIVTNRQLIHKIGVTGNKVEARIANAKNDATFLLSDVEIVRTYKLVGIKRKNLENLLHKFLAPARIDMEIKDRFGKKVKPKEWFLVPLPVIDRIVELIETKELVNYYYDPASATLKKAKA